MPLLRQSRYVILHNGTEAGSALGCEHIEVVLFAVWLAFAFVESFFAELFAALRAKEVLRVPGLFQSGHAFLPRHPPTYRIKM